MGKRRKQQVHDGTGSCSLDPACRRLRCYGRLAADPRQQHHPAGPWVTKQPSLGIALLAPHGDGPRKGGLNMACLTRPGWPTAANGHHYTRCEEKSKEPETCVLECTHNDGLGP
jgi:hypothetical protein